jgi:hypothetical protein
MAEEELRRRGRPANEAARLARAGAGGHTQALEALRERRGLPWLDSSWLDIKLGCRLLVRHWGVTIVGGLALSVAIGIAAVVFTGLDVLRWSELPLEDGNRVVVVQVWDAKASERRDVSWQDVDRWRSDLRTISDVGAFQTTQRNTILDDGSVELVAVAEMSASGFRVARVSPMRGRALVDADAELTAPPVVVISREVWQRRFAERSDVIGATLRLGDTVHTVVGVMPEGFRFPFNFQYWVPLKRAQTDMLRNAGPEGAVFGRLAADATLERASAEVSTVGLLTMPQVNGGDRPRGAAHVRVHRQRRIWPTRADVVARESCVGADVAAALRQHRDPELRAHRHAPAGVCRAPCAWRQSRAHSVAVVSRVARAHDRSRSCRVGDRASGVGGRRRTAADHPRRPAVLDALRRLVQNRAVCRRPGCCRRRDVGPHAGTARHSSRGATRRRRAGWTNERATRRDVDGARHRAGRVLSVGVLPIAAELAWGTLRTRTARSGFRGRGDCMRASRSPMGRSGRRRIVSRVDTAS